MHLTVGGKARTADLGRDVAEAAARLQAAGGIGALSPGPSALALKASADRAD